MSLLKVERLSKTFGAVRAVEDVSFEVGEGEIYGLLGPNGAGKTTTISIIAGLLKADGGRVLVAGTDFGSDPERAPKRSWVWCRRRSPCTRSCQGGRTWNSGAGSRASPGHRHVSAPASCWRRCRSRIARKTRSRLTRVA